MINKINSVLNFLEHKKKYSKNKQSFDTQINTLKSTKENIDVLLNKTIYKDGEFLNQTTLTEIRNRTKNL